MGAIAISKKEYKELKQKAALYDAFMKIAPEKIELYSEKRIKDFRKEDRVSKDTREKVEKLLKSLDAGIS